MKNRLAIWWTEVVSTPALWLPRRLVLVELRGWDVPGERGRGSGGECVAAGGKMQKLFWPANLLRATGGEYFWPIERRPFKLEELVRGPREVVSTLREESLAPVRACTSQDAPESCWLCDPYSRKAWARGPEIQV